MTLYLTKSILLLALSCVFVWKVTACAFDFVHTPITNIRELRRIAVLFVATLTGFIVSFTLLGAIIQP